MNGVNVINKVPSEVSLRKCPIHYDIHNEAAQNCTQSADPNALDRIDLQIEVTPVPLKDLTQMPQGESSAQIRERVIAARAIQSERFKDNKGIYCNAQMSARMILQYAKLDENGERLLAVAMTRLGLSARAYERILKMARTIADLEASPSIQGHHIREAISYRNLDRNTWGE